MREGNYWTEVFRRRMTRRRALLAAGSGAAGAGAIGLVGCGDDDDDDDDEEAGTAPTGGTAAAGDIRRGGTYVASVPIDPPTLDPYKNLSYLTQTVAGYAYSRLLKFQTGPDVLPSDYLPEPDLAEALPESPDAITWTFKIRPEAVYAPGDPLQGRAVTAEDVRYSYERFINTPENERKNDVIPVIDRVEVIDDKTVQFTLKQAYADFITLMASSSHLWIVPPEVVESGLVESKPIGSGPFMLESYERSRQMTFAKNPGYWVMGDDGQPLPYIDRNQYLVIADAQTTVAQFTSGQLHGLTITEEQRGQIESDVSGVLIYDFLANLLNQFWFDPRTYSEDLPPFNDERVRQAISMSVDRAGLIRLIFNGQGEWHNQGVPAGLSYWWLDPQGENIGEGGQYYQYNPEEARKLLEAAGVPDLKVRVHYTEDGYRSIAGGFYNRIADSLPGMFRESGIEVELVPESYSAVYVPQTLAGNFDSMAWSLSTPFNFIHLYLVNYYTGTAGRDRGVRDQEILDLIDRQIQTVDQEERRELIYEIQRIASVKQYFPGGVLGPSFQAVQPQIKNYFVTGSYGTGTETIAKLWIDA
ncbi:MAG TPA: ABC transporter substrate-binding protein [Dehalococcoidia bacterium]|nr:ABC transporter substrate-binding protein [Dehalococcoidia bacterium]